MRLDFALAWLEIAWTEFWHFLGISMIILVPYLLGILTGIGLFFWLL